MTRLDRWKTRLAEGKFPLTEKQVSRLLKQIAFGEVDECWLWTGCCNVYGYPVFGYQEQGRNKQKQVSRIVYSALIDVNIDGLCVCHTCDVRRCLNPKHLWLGTVTENNRDRAKKGRNKNQSGTANPQAKVNEKQIKEIRRLYEQGGFLQREIGEMFGLSQSSVGLIVRRERWSHV